MAHFLGIAGTHSTGKSTFLKRLRGLLEADGCRVTVVGDKASECREAGFEILRQHTFESTLWIMTSVIQAELEAGLRSDFVLVDRPVPDAIGYLEAALETESRPISSMEREYLYSLARLHTSRYDVMLKTELDSTIRLGDGRDSDMVFRELVDSKIREVLLELRTPYSTLHSEGVECAVAYIHARCRLLIRQGRG